MSVPPPGIDSAGQCILDARQCIDDGRYGEAARLCQSIPASHPLHTRSLQMLILALRRDGRFAESLAPCLSWQRLEPENGRAWLMEGLAHEQAGDTGRAVASLRGAIQRSPSSAGYYTILAPILRRHEDLDACIGLLEDGVQRVPDNPALLVALGGALIDAARFRDAERVFLRALALAPEDASVACAAARLYARCHAYEVAIQQFRRSIERRPSVAAYCGLALALRQQARHLEIDEVMLKALQFDPMSSFANSIRLYSLLHRADLDADIVANEHRAWGDRLVARNNPWRISHQRRERRTGKRLKLGYVSSVFADHVTKYFLMPLLQAHDRERFEISLYAHVGKATQATAQYRELAGNWCEIQGSNDLDIARQIRADEVDILIDIQGPSEKREFLNLLALKPAPIQLSWLGYPATCGVSTVDYRFGDDIADPQAHDRHFTEQIIRLPDGFLCYDPPAIAGYVAPPPFLENGHVTFGMFNAATKLNIFSCMLWARILQAVPHSRMLMKGRAFADEATTARFRRMFDHAGMPLDRLDILPYQVTGDDHFGAYDRVDIALDSFPYTGTTTTCETLWKGVPVVTLAGDRHVQRVSASLLHRIGLDDLVATNPDDYVARATRLAMDVERLGSLRHSIRDRMQNSPLTDRQSYARHVEKAFEWMWHRWNSADRPCSQDIFRANSEE